MKARVIALYLPQFHPIPENDEWWGKGFTEWTNVGKAKPLFLGHYQPHVPADLGYYDLRVPETRIAQAEMAREHGIEGFMYWHYWFGNGKRLLERPFDEVLNSGEPDFPFALAWANESWKGFAHGLSDTRKVLIEQTYPGDEDYINHFNLLLPAFKDHRYIMVEGKPIFMIYKPEQLPNPTHFINLWQNLARKNGLKGIYFIAHNNNVMNKGESEAEYVERMCSYGFNSVCFVRLFEYSVKRNVFSKAIMKLLRTLFKMPLVLQYKNAIRYFSKEIDKKENVIPAIIPNWDHSPRSGRRAFLFFNSTPKLFGVHLSEVLHKVQNKPNERKLIILKSWNEWAEGNYVEPDLKYGMQFLHELKKQISE